MHLYLKKHLLLFLALITFYSVFAQTTTKDSVSTKKVKGWQQGYIVMNTNDTVYGLVKKIGVMQNPVSAVYFKMNKEGKMIEYDTDSISTLKYSDEIWQNFDSWGWSKNILTGMISIYKGAFFDGQSSSLEVLLFIKKNQCGKYIKQTETKPFTGPFFKAGGILTEKVKNRFKDYISDNPELLAEFEKSTFRYEQLENLILRYNEWANANNK